MQYRLRLLKGAMALLYFGPLLAGLGGFGWTVVPPFAVIFMLWLFVLRPQQWPRSLADWTRPEAMIAIATQGFVQVLLVAVSFGIGRGIGGVMEFLPSFPLMLPVAISFLSIPLARMLWDPWKADKMEAFLDPALVRPDASVVDLAPADLPGRVAVATRMLAALDQLPETASPEHLAGHLRAMTTQTSDAALREVLMGWVHDRLASPVQWRAAVVHATDGSVATRLAGASYAAALFQVLDDPALGALFAHRCLALIVESPDRAADCPTAEQVRALAQTMPAAAEALSALALGLDHAGAGAS